MTKPERNKLVAGGILMVMAIVMLAFAFRPDTPPVAAKSASSSRPSVVDTLSAPEAGIPARGKKTRSASSSAIALDPSLRLDLLAKLQGIQYEGTERNIFQFYTRPPEIPKPIASATVTTPAPTVPPAPPPAPPIPLKFYGFASAPGETPRKAFLSDAEDIFIAMEGDVVKRRYRVLKIGPNSIEMEDMQTNSKQKLPLQET